MFLLWEHWATITKGWKHVRRKHKHKHKDVHTSEISITQGHTQAQCFSSIRLDISTDKNIPFLSCLCLRCPHVRHNNAIKIQAQVQASSRQVHIYFFLCLRRPGSRRVIFLVLMLMLTSYVWTSLNLSFSWLNLFFVLFFCYAQLDSILSIEGLCHLSICSILNAELKT